LPGGIDTFKQAPRPLREVIEGIRRMPSIKLEKEELEQLVSKLKTVQARKLRKKLAAVGAVAEA
jgi:hypothetical protein